MKLSRRTLLATPALLAVPKPEKQKLVRYEARLREELAKQGDFIFRQSDYEPRRGSAPWIPLEEKG